MCLVSFSKDGEYSSKKKFDVFNNKQPVWAYIELTDFCSHKCSWCYGDFPSKDKKYLDTDSLRVVLTKLKEIGIQQLSIGGGEPTEHPDWDEVQSIIGEYDFKSKHLLTHGDNLDVSKFKETGITSVHLNYQGSKRHKAIHKTDYQDQLNGIDNCKEAGIPITASITVGKYNLKDLDSIIEETDDLGFNRVRFWETTGVGVDFLKDLDVKEIFDECSKVSKKYGYTHSYSYEPWYRDADINVPCIQVSNLGMYIDYNGRLKFCGATAKDMFITDMINNESEEILNSYLEYNKNFNCNNCEARNATYKEPDDIRWG